MEITPIQIIIHTSYIITDHSINLIIISISNLYNRSFISSNIEIMLTYAYSFIIAATDYSNALVRTALSVIP